MSKITNEKLIENCPNCHRQLTGTIEVSSGIIDGISTIMLEETPDRNWIVCDFCNQTICKSCCLNPGSGYCNRCLTAYQTESVL